MISVVRSPFYDFQAAEWAFLLISSAFMVLRKPRTPLSLESSSSPGYDSGLTCDKWGNVG